MRFFASFLFIFTNYFHLTAQVWYFGNGAGLDFSSGNPKSVSGGKIFTLEGCAVAYDEKGEVALYTDGITVWNKLHQEIQNGSGLNGSRSSTQAALIVPRPEVAGKYFVFTTDEKAGKNGFCYSVVDLSGAKGAVVKKKYSVTARYSRKINICTKCK